MVDFPQVRRTEKQMSDAGTQDLLEHGYCGRLATVGPDGWPYVVPLLYVWMDGEIYMHHTRARGHLQQNLDHNPRVCFEVDEPGEVFACGPSECDTTIRYRSVVCFGTVRVVEDAEVKACVCTALMRKYAGEIGGRPKDRFPSLDSITVYAVSIKHLSGKETPLPVTEESKR